MFIVYKRYDHSVLATLISVLSRLIVAFALVIGWDMIKEHQVASTVICVAVIVVSFVGGNILSKSVATKAEMKLDEKERSRRANLIPSHEIEVEENGQIIRKTVLDQENKDLIYPAKVTICRDKAFAASAIAIEYTLNDQQQCKLRNNQTYTFQATNSLNKVTTKQGAPVTFVVSENESVKLHFKAQEFVRMERVPK